jgi:hypothetical protein
VVVEINNETLSQNAAMSGEINCSHSVKIRMLDVSQTQKRLETFTANECCNILSGDEPRLLISETLVFNTKLTRLIARENFIVSQIVNIEPAISKIT